MKVFEPGKEYRTRCGDRARVYALDGDEGYPIHGAILYDSEEGLWTGECWTAEGLFNEDEYDSRDLTDKEWEEPKPSPIMRSVSVELHGEEFADGGNKYFTAAEVPDTHIADTEHSWKAYVVGKGGKRYLLDYTVRVMRIDYPRGEQA